ncbi:MAG: hypothetical protein LBM12_00065 [Candidatus Nomurabacteria bacterium]|jgi:hypothetical protein|nr:hypothetical protein [Candidatus Nomurabacteria bacterium]
MIKNHVKRGLQKILGVRTWMLVVIWVAVFPVMLVALRVDNLRMERLRSAVMTADDEGDKAKIDTALNKLLDFSSSHMNANTGVFYLQSSYARAVEAAATESSEKNIHKETSEYCGRLFNHKWSMAFVNCWKERLATYPAGLVADFPDPALFKYEFISPVFSLTVAGVIVAIWCLLSVVICLRLLYYVILRISLLIIKKRS